MRHLLSPAVWGLLAGLTGLAGYIPYVRDAWRRASDPDPAAWLIWTVEYSVLLAVQAAQHPPWAALCLAALQLAGTAAVLGVLAVRGGWRFGPGRWVLLGGTVAVMGAWPFAHAPGLAMCLVLGVEGTAMVLVMVSAYRHPRSETPLTWQAFILAGLLDLPALGGHAPRLLYAYPSFFVVMGSGVLIAAALGDRASRVPVPRVRYLPQDPEPAAPVSRPACPAGQWEILRAAPRALPGPGWPQAVPRLSQPQARPYLSQPLPLPLPGRGQAEAVTLASRPQARPYLGPLQGRPHPAHRPGLPEGSPGDGRRGPDEAGDRVIRGEPGQVGQDEQGLRADHGGEVVLELGQARRIRAH
ncbi:MAG TPA: hypothetical protein VF933_09060 [Streptosporangiaceae bacterium]